MDGCYGAKLHACTLLCRLITRNTTLKPRLQPRSFLIFRCTPQGPAANRCAILMKLQQHFCRPLVLFRLLPYPQVARLAAISIDAICRAEATPWTRKEKARRRNHTSCTGLNFRQHKPLLNQSYNAMRTNSTLPTRNKARRLNHTSCVRQPATDTGSNTVTR